MVDIVRDIIHYINKYAIIHLRSTWGKGKIAIDQIKVPLKMDSMHYTYFVHTYKYYEDNSLILIYNIWITPCAIRIASIQTNHASSFFDKN